uniref:GNAT family N-acetyltransferase n=1 Tax=Lysinibacillus piscis TaxID=2518931 RepID=UPI0035A23C54
MDFVQYRTTVELVKGSREDYLSYLLLADEDEEIVRQYMHSGELYAIKCGEQIAGVALLLALSDEVVELKNIAILPKYQGKGIGKVVINILTNLCQSQGYRILQVGTANSSIDNIAFYQKAGFRMERIEKDFFSSYAEPIYEHGIRAYDMLYFSKKL